MIDFINRVKRYKSKNATTVVYNTHPSSNDRIDALQNIIITENFDLKKPKVKDRFWNEISHLNKKEMKVFKN